MESASEVISPVEEAAVPKGDKIQQGFQMYVKVDHSLYTHHVCFYYKI